MLRNLYFGLFVAVLCCFISVSCSDQSAERKGYIIGIDLGTTYSCVGVYRNGKVEIIQNTQGNRITPSYVAFKPNGERIIGDAAKLQLTTYPESTIFDVKRLIGKRFDDESVKADMKYWPFKVIDRNGLPYIQIVVNGEKKTFAPQELSAMVLGYMKEIAETYLEQPVLNAVITVPAYFTDAQKKATKDAGTIANFTVDRIINEPTAAAIAYGLNKKDGEKNILVFDLGGGTYDVSILTVDDGVFEVLATNGDPHLGGQDFDNTLAAHFIDVIKKEYKRDPSKNKLALQRIRAEAEKIKRTLSRKHQAEVEILNVMGVDTFDFTYTITRAKFEALNAEAFRRTLKPLEEVLKSSELKKSQIDEIVLVGGSTRIPKIQSMVKDFFGKEPSRGVNPDEAVAFGAAVQGGILRGDESTSDLVLLDVTSLSLGIETVGGVMTKLIEKNSRIPTSKTQVFSTAADDQTAVTIQVYEGERSMVKDNNLLGKFNLDGIPKAPRGVPQIEVKFDVDSNGMLVVTATDKGTGKQANVTITNDAGRLSPEEIEKMIKDAERFQDEDKKAKEKAEAKIDYEGYVYNVRNLLADSKQLGGKVTEEEKSTLERAVSDAISWIDSHSSADAQDIKDKKEEFVKLVEPIMSKYQPASAGASPPHGPDVNPNPEADAAGKDEL